MRGISCQTEELLARKKDSAACSELGKINVKCTLAQVLMLCTGRMARRGSRGIALLFLGHGTGWG